MKMKACGLVMLVMALVVPVFAESKPATMEETVKSYFSNHFDNLEEVAAANPTKDSFRKMMAPVVKETKGFFGGTLIDTDYVIRQVYFKKNFLARGFDLKKVEQLADFWKMMSEKPAPQLSEPAHGSLVQPRLVAMRYPVIVDGELQGVVSMMIRTEEFLKEVGLDQCSAYKIVCMGKLAEEKGTLSQSPKEVKLSLPSTEWIIQYDD